MLALNAGDWFRKINAHITRNTCSKTGLLVQPKNPLSLCELVRPEFKDGINNVRHGNEINKANSTNSCTQRQNKLTNGGTEEKTFTFWKMEKATNMSSFAQTKSVKYSG